MSKNKIAKLSILLLFISNLCISQSIDKQLVEEKCQAFVQGEIVLYTNKNFKLLEQVLTPRALTFSQLRFERYTFNEEKYRTKSKLEKFAKADLQEIIVKKDTAKCIYNFKESGIGDLLLVKQNDTWLIDGTIGYHITDGNIRFEQHQINQIKADKEKAENQIIVIDNLNEFKKGINQMFYSNEFEKLEAVCTDQMLAFLKDLRKECERRVLIEDTLEKIEELKNWYWISNNEFNDKTVTCTLQPRNISIKRVIHLLENSQGDWKVNGIATYIGDDLTTKLFENEYENILKHLGIFSK